MSIEFYPYQTILSNSNILNNIPSASISFLLKINSNSDLSDVGTSFIASNEFYSKYYFSLIGSGTNPNTIKARTAWRNLNSTSTTKDIDLPIGVPIHIASTYANGLQMLYVNGVDTVISSLTGNIQSNSHRFRIGGWDLTPNSGYSWQLDNLSIWQNYALTKEDVLNLRSGAAPSSIQGSYSGRTEWSLDGPLGSSVRIGDSGINDLYGLYNFTTLAGSSAPIYSEDLIWEPSAYIMEGYLGTCGETLFFRFMTANSGDATPIQTYNPISIYKNGNYIGQSKDLWLTGSHNCIMYTFPSGESANANDEISISTSGWILTTAGDVQDETNYVVENKFGRSCFGTENVNKTLNIGFNVGSPVDPGNINIVFKNLSLRCAPFQGTTTNISGYPISASVVNSAASIVAINLSNYIDDTGMPGITGLVAVSWDRTSNSAPTTFFLHSSDFSTNYIRCVERLDLYNSGDTITYPEKTIGITRVYDIQLTNPSSVYTPLTLYFTVTSGTPYFDNLSVQHELDFTYTSGVPVTLDRSDKFAVSNLFLERTKNAGSIRFMDQLVGNPNQSNIIEYEDAINMDAYCFSNFSKRRWIVYYDHLKHFYPGNSPYIYSPVFGSSYPATLGENINSTQNQIVINDANTAPVFYGLNLFIDDEILNIVEASGNVMTVIRGHNDTTPTSHNSGIISVGYRFPSSGIFGSSVTYELVSPSAHYLKTGYYIPLDGGTYPYINYTDGTSGQIWTSSFVINSPAFVTSPSSYVIVRQVASYTEVSGIYNIYGNYSSARIPYNFNLSSNQCLPPGAAAHAAGQVDGANFYWTLPHAASDDFIIKAGRDVRDNFPAGRNIYIEIGNEIWNYLNPNSYIRALSKSLNMSYVYGYNIKRTIEARDILRSIFNEGGRNRGDEIKTTFNVQTVVGTASPPLIFAASNGFELDSICNAPYIGPYYQHAATISGYTFCNISQSLDLYIHDLYYGSDTSSFNYVMQDHMDAINVYNTSGYNCKMISYEGGLERPIGTATPWSKQRTRDMIYSPNQIIIEQDWYNLLQSKGYTQFNAFTLANIYYQGVYHWTHYGGFLQRPGLGDGSDGLYDNTKWLATPGYEYSKPTVVNQDANSVSTRGKAFLLWNEEVRNNIFTVAKSVLSYLPQNIFRNIFVKGN